MRGQIRTAMGVIEWMLLLILGVLWGGSYFFGQVALTELPPFTVAACRLGLAAAALNVVVRAAGHRLPGPGRAWRAFFIMGLLNNAIPMSLILWGQSRIGSGLAAILNASTPLFTVLLAHLLTGDERMTRNRVGGVLFGLVGVAVMIGPGALGGDLGGFRGDIVPQLAVLGAAASYACAGIFGRRFADSPPLLTAAGQVTASTVMLVPLSLAADRPWLLPAPNVKTWAAVVALALLCTSLAYVIYFRILATSGASNLLLVTLLMPVTAVLLGFAVLGERLEPRQLAGMALVAAGLAAIDGRAVTLLRRLPARLAAC